MTYLLKNMLVTLTISAKYISEFVSLYLKPKKSNLNTDNFFAKQASKDSRHTI